MEGIDIEKMYCDTYSKMLVILSDEIDDPEFLEYAIEMLLACPTCFPAQTYHSVQAGW